MWEVLGRFGLEQCDLPTMLWNVSVMLRAQALNIDPSHTKRIPITSFLLTAVCAVSYFYTYLFSMLWFVFVRSPQTGDQVAAMVVLSLGVSTEITVVLFVNLFIMNKRVKETFQLYIDCDALVAPGRFSTTLMRNLRTVKKRAVYFWIFINTNGIVYVLMPFLRPGKHLLEDMYIVYGLEPSMESPNFELTTALMVICVISNCFLTANIHALFIVLTGYSESRLRALTEDILNIWADSTHELNKTRQDMTPIEYTHRANKEINRRLRILIKEHITNINLIARMEEIFKLPIAIGLVFVSIGLCAELLGGLENTFLQIPYAVIQILMQCLTGQRLIDASQAFSAAVYSCKWENFDKANMKLVLSMLQVSQKTLKLSAGGVQPLSFALAMSLLKSTYSAYAALT